MKRFKKNIILILIICIIVLYFVLKDDFNGIVNLLINSNKLYVLIAIAFVILSDVFKGLSVTKLVRSLNYDYKFKSGFSLMLMANFFNGVTPFSLGGQPFELYVLKKDDDIDYISGSNILFRDFYTYQMGLMFLTLICIIVNYIFNIVIYSKMVEKILWIGLIINIVITIVLIYVPYSKKNEYNFINKIIFLLNKLNIVKDKDFTINKINESINKFKYQTKDAIKNKKVIIICSLLNCLKLICVGIATFYCFKAIGSSVEIYKTCMIFILIIIMASFVPIPGASGGMEFSFIQLFSYFVIDTKLGAAMLIWRFITYYLPIIYGSIIFVIKRR